MKHKTLAVCAVLITTLSSSLSSQNLDIRLLRSVNSQQDLPSDGFFKLVSNSEVFLAVGVPAGMAVTGLIKDDRKLIRNACASLAAAAVTSGITNVLKYTINRERPFITYPDILQKSRAGSPSFPSGHTSSAFAAATSVSLAYPKWYIIAPSYLWAGTVAYSRMELGVHYPSDVLAGALIGSGTAYLSYKINKKLYFRKYHHPVKNRKVKACDCPD